MWYDLKAVHACALARSRFTIQIWAFDIGILRVWIDMQTANRCTATSRVQTSIYAAHESSREWASVCLTTHIPQNKNDFFPSLLLWFICQNVFGTYTVPLRARFICFAFCVLFSFDLCAHIMPFFLVVCALFFHSLWLASALCMERQIFLLVCQLRRAKKAQQNINVNVCRSQQRQQRRRRKKNRQSWAGNHSNWTRQSRDNKHARAHSANMNMKRASVGNAPINNNNTHAFLVARSCSCARNFFLLHLFFCCI